MKRAGKVAVAILVAGLFLSGLLTFEFHRRAAAAIRRHEEQLALDIRTLRARLAADQAKLRACAAFRNPKARSSGEFLLLLASLSTNPGLNDLKRDLNDQGTFLPYEELDKARRVVPRIGFHRINYPPDDGVDTVLTILFLVQELTRGGDLAAGEALAQCEMGILSCARERVERGEYPEKDLAALDEGLTQLEATRPRMADFFSVESILVRQQLLSLFRSHEYAAAFANSPPGWKMMFSWKVHLIRELNRVETETHENEALDSLPLDARREVARALEDSRTGFYLANDATRNQMQEACRSEEGARVAWAHTRIAVALARFEARHGERAKALADLVPDFLPAVPGHPVTGRPFRYENGKLSVDPDSATER